MYWNALKLCNFMKFQNEPLCEHSVCSPTGCYGYPLLKEPNELLKFSLFSSSVWDPWYCTTEFFCFKKFWTVWTSFFLLWKMSFPQMKFILGVLKGEFDNIYYVDFFLHWQCLKSQEHSICVSISVQFRLVFCEKIFAQQSSFVLHNHSFFFTCV